MLFLFLFDTLSHFEGNNREVIKHNQVTKVQCYLYDIEKGKVLQDSSLHIERIFNKEGFRTEILIYKDSNKVRNLYEYKYKEDSILMVRNTYVGRRTSLLEKSVLIYNDKKQAIAQEYYNANGKKSTMKFLFGYDKNGHYSKLDRQKNEKTILEERYVNTPDGKPVEVIIKNVYPSKKKRKSKFKIHYFKGKKTHTYFHYKKNRMKLRELVQEISYDEQQRPQTILSRNNGNRRIIGVSGWQDLKNGDKTKIEIEYKDNGLIHQETEYINDTLNAVKKYFYEFAP